MSDNKKHIKQYSASDIQRYLKGQMSAEDMHAIEIAALDDPFLADAIEGFQGTMEVNEESVNRGLGELGEEFNERIKRPARVVPMTQGRWWQIAAAAMILLIVGVAFFNNWIKPEETTKALATKEKKSNDSIASQQNEERSSSASLMDTQPHNKKLTTPTSPPTEIVSNPFSASGEDASAKKRLEEEADAGGRLNQKDEPVTKSAERSNVKEQSASRPPASHDNTPEREQELAAATISEAPVQRNKQSGNQLNNFSGRVVDADNKPLVNASLRILQNQTSLVTDQTGNFNFSIKDSVVDVQVGMVGYEQRHFRLKHDLTSNRLVLEPSKHSFDEVVVTGYGTERKQGARKSKTADGITDKDGKSQTPVKPQNAVPLSGWMEYEKYIQKNKKLPISNPLLKGEVVVSFQVKRSGTLSDFKIEKHLSKDHDEEAIRLIKEGPGWKNLDNRKTRVTVIVDF